MSPRAVMLTHAKEPLVVAPREVGAPGPGDVRLALECCTLGLSDWNALTLDAPPRLPLVPGQEAVGRVEAVGQGAALHVGQRVAVTPLATSCGSCEVCLTGQARWCARAAWHGLQRDGALATHGVFAAQHLVPIDEGDDAAQVACWVGSGWTALGALRAGGVDRGTRVAVFGVGGVGHLAVQLALHRGAEVSVVDLDVERRKFGETLGASSVLPPGGVEVALVCTPSIQAVQQAVRSLRPGGVAVLVGSTPTGRVDVGLSDVVLRGVTLRGSVVGSAVDLREVLALGRAGVLLARVDVAPLEAAAERLWWLRDGGFIGRLVFECATAPAS
ncbi:MAG: alcohol dehydrogenase catalytic domain-containing protein [Archangium sp.]|nr:alcohol dehydrogenase catalytic domain-containing protein [Archangium sp.]